MKLNNLFNIHHVKSVVISSFFRQLSTLLSAGIPLISGLLIISKDINNIVFKECIIDLKSIIESGHPFSKALLKYPRYFNPLYSQLIAIGEISGTLDVVLHHVVTHQEKSHTLRQKIRKACTYPIVVLVISLIITSIILLTVVPLFEQLFHSLGSELPFLTRCVIHAANLLKLYVWLWVILIVGGIIFLRKHYRSSDTFQKRADKILLHIPLIGSLLRKAVIARFARTLSLTLTAGIPLLDALEPVSQSLGNRYYAQALHDIKYLISQGTSIHTALHKTGVFPQRVIQMVAIGEEAGSLDDMLLHMVSSFETEVDSAIDQLSTLLEPLMMMILGIIIGGLVIALYLPLFQMGTLF